VSVYRTIIFLAGCAVAVLGRAEAITLWSWSSGDAATTQRILELKRWLDPLSVACLFLWKALHILEEPMRKTPLPVDKWSRWPQLRRPALLLIVSLTIDVPPVF
jgi:hypothetical protein